MGSIKAFLAVSRRGLRNQLLSISGLTTKKAVCLRSRSGFSFTIFEAGSLDSFFKNIYYTKTLYFCNILGLTKPSRDVISFSIEELKESIWTRSQRVRAIIG